MAPDGIRLLPLIRYVVLQCNPPRLASTLAYVQRFRSPMALKSEAGCYFTHLQAAVSFLQSLHREGCARDGGGGGAHGEQLPRCSGEGGASIVVPVSMEPSGSMAAPDARAASEAAAAAVMEANYEQQQQAWNRMLEARGGRRAQQRAATGSEGADSHGADGAGSGLDRATMPTLSTRRGLGDEGDEEEGEEEGETRKGSSLRDEVMASPSRARAHSISEGLRFTPSRRPGPLGDWSFSRTALAQRRTETVEEAASQWEEKIEALSLLSAPAAASSPGLLAGSLLGLAFGANSCSERESAFGPSASFPSFDDEGTNGDGSIRIGNPLRPLDEGDGEGDEEDEFAAAMLSGLVDVDLSGRSTPAATGAASATSTAVLVPFPAAPPLAPPLASTAGASVAAAKGRAERRAERNDSEVSAGGRRDSGRDSGHFQHFPTAFR